MLRLSIACIFLLFISCKKDNDHSFSILGKWQLIEIFDANAGGCACWKEMDDAQTHVLAFNANGTYLITPGISNGFNNCSGDYERKNDSTILWRRCGAAAYATKISKVGPLLLLEEANLGGYIIYKYKPLR